MLHPRHHHVGEILEQPEPRTIHRFLRAGALLEFGIGAADRFVGPLEELLPVLMRNAEQLRDNRERNLRRYLGDEIAFAASGHVVEHFAGDVFDFGLQRAHSARSELATDDHAILTVIGRVHIEQMTEWRGRVFVPSRFVYRYSEAPAVE